ncbi:hypothetical protein A6280_25640 [Bacillus wiedmannii]|uniref:hypothetical protein n=1 Tax=Bacillus wiedmannii TaxID=1890302 RepID=UPI0007DAFF71|nr:hypothetical protein [Bacillus wiedmannii]OAK08753.1 hypothetical protein A6280_25640 [Bacillus wiedmannii]
MRIVESAKDYENIIFKKKIPVDKFSFMKKVSNAKGMEDEFHSPIYQGYSGRFVKLSRNKTK